MSPQFRFWSSPHPCTPEAQAVAGNLLEAMRFFGRAREEGNVTEHPGVSLICCGFNYAAFNAAVLSTPIGSSTSDLKRRLQLSSDQFTARKFRWTYWLCDDFLAANTRRESKTLFRRYGLSALTEPPGMFAERLEPPKRHLPRIEVRRVADEESRLAFAHITSVSFEIPRSVCHDIYAGARAWSGSFQGYVGYADGVPVATTATVIEGGVIGIYSVGTVPEHRRRGYAEATMRAVLAIERERSGIETTVLQSTSAGLPLYERMGYRKVTRFSVYIS